MSWADVPAKLASYRTMEYSNNEQADKLIDTYGGKRITDKYGNYVRSVDYIPANRQADFEAELDMRIGACGNLSDSVAWKPGRNYPT